MLTSSREMPTTGFWRPGDGGESGTTGIDDAAVAYNPDKRHLPLAVQRAQLPICEHRRQLLYTVETHQVTLLTLETGSGKSTRMSLPSSLCAQHRKLISPPRDSAVFVRSRLGI